MTWERDLAEHIAALGFGVAGVDILVGPPTDDDTTPNQCLGLVSRPGPVDETYGAVYGRPNLTIVQRSEPFAGDAPLERLQQIFVALTKIANTTIGSTKLLRLEPLAWPGYLRTDSQFRRDYTCEIGVWLDEM